MEENTEGEIQRLRSALVKRVGDIFADEEVRRIIEALQKYGVLVVGIGIIFQLDNSNESGTTELSSNCQLFLEKINVQW